jgi:hypothetical protein
LQAAMPSLEHSRSFMTSAAAAAAASDMAKQVRPPQLVSHITLSACFRSAGRTRCRDNSDSG